ncbi:flagellar hook assembly protein FlgD [Ureibacillus sp. FSL K6-8385]|uniref:Basal-body rod modification protein FlgD n=1 Tax=Ureibacillus terrenus TaxID=118246 RepID=A0A540V4E6_9BACL|nr:flagellar hook assembly protein FlgD [Ureibacillus terrenus]MED3660402.1 flagellar hook assembly protein FlgD [Ureibacillus terrenus]MED3762558.1 flagellar hook assembly protein FlgD [Ureibacillus terrenus]TQE91621.1 flagellar hook assembly protein FlgD [Ureibacillus terrenus]
MSEMSKITSDYYLSNAKKVEKKTGNSVLGKDDFLKILITQLQHQDPTAPVNDKEFIAQMAQFSALEQMQNMTKAMEDLLESQLETQLMAYTSFLGQEVKWHEITDQLDKNGMPIINEGQGRIVELKFKNQMPVFVLDDGKEIGAGNISSVLKRDAGQSVSENPLVEASRLIGRKVQYQNENGEIVQGIIEAVTSNNQWIEFILDNQIRLKKGQFELVQE